MRPEEIGNKTERLTDLCREAREKYQPDSQTYCNLAVRYVARGFAEYTGFRNFLANRMIKWMEDQPEWATVEPEVAKKCADDGKLVVAGTRGDPHGHVAVVLPGRALVPSGKWGGQWPVVSNVGKQNWICGANYAFSKRPKFYVLIDGA